MPRSARKTAAMTLKIGKNAITALGMKPVKLAFEKCFEIHRMLQYRATVLANRTAARQPFASRFSINCGKRPGVLNYSRQKLRKNKGSSLDQDQILKKRGRRPSPSLDNRLLQFNLPP
jgi:hypothetical protein